MRIRNTAKALIEDKGKVLLIRKMYPDSSAIYTLPGGSQNINETLEDALHREVREEIDGKILGYSLVKVYEFFYEKEGKDNLRHKVEYIFRCQFETPYTPKMGPHPDPHQESVLWVPLEDFNKITFRPALLGNIIYEACKGSGPLYVGKVE